MAYGLTGYDCGGTGLNITTLSLLDVGECDIADIEPIKTSVHIQLLQTAEYETIAAYQCKVEIDRTIYYCGMHSHVSIVTEGRKQYVKEIGAYNCQKIHETGSMTLGTAFVDRLLNNATNHRSVMLAGQAFTDGRCAGTQYTDGYGTWENVVVQATVKITLRTFTMPFRRSINEVNLPSGTQCPSTQGGCNDWDGTETFWNLPYTDGCHFSKYDILYEGTATKLSPKKHEQAPEVYTVTTKDTTFALAKTTETNLCGYKLYHTEHPKLLIFETQPGKSFQSKTRTSVNNLDIFSYVNSKFVYVEKHIKTQLTRLYKDIMEQKCALEKQILQNALSLSSIAPDEMAFRIMKSPGYTAVTAGEVIHIIKCVPVECKLRRTDTCYNELPVTYRNHSLYLQPRSRILSRTGTPRDCNELLPNLFRIDTTWYRLAGSISESLPPPTIQPLTKPSWKYVSPDALATSGIYTPEDLDRLRDHIMFPVEKPSMLNTIARGAMGQEIPKGTIAMINLLDEASLDHIAENAGKRLWDGFITFGSASAGVLAIFIIGRTIKLLVDTIIHGYALHSIYGWSIHLIGAIWSSVTHLLLFLGKSDKAEVTHEEEGRQGEDASAPISQEKDSEVRTVPEQSYAELRRYLHANE